MIDRVECMIRSGHPKPRVLDTDGMESGVMGLPPTGHAGGPWRGRMLRERSCGTNSGRESFDPPLPEVNWASPERHSEICPGVLPSAELGVRLSCLHSAARQSQPPTLDHRPKTMTAATCGVWRRHVDRGVQEQKDAVKE